MPWKWDPTRKHDVHIAVTPTTGDESALGIVWGNNPVKTKTVATADVAELLAQLLQDLQRLGFQV
jgi:hypothetical protein